MHDITTVGAFSVFMPIGKPITREDEDFTDLLLLRLSRAKLTFLLVPFAGEVTKSAVTIRLPFRWTSQLEQAFFDLKRSKLSCLVIEEAFEQLIRVLNAKFEGMVIAIGSLGPEERGPQGDVLRGAQVDRRLELKYAVSTEPLEPTGPLSTV